jgi:hypothetical protein
MPEPELPAIATKMQEKDVSDILVGNSRGSRPEREAIVGASP